MLSIQSLQKGPTAVVILVPVLTLGLPILEAAVTIARRALVAGIASVFQADQAHIHHRLLDLGMTQRRAVLVLYGVCAAFGALAFVAVSMHGIGNAAIVGGVAVGHLPGDSPARLPRPMIERGDIASLALLALAAAIVLWVRLVPLSLPVVPERAALMVRTQIGARLAAERPDAASAAERQAAVDRWIAAHPDEFARDVAAETARLTAALQYEDDAGRRRPFLGDYDSYTWLRAARNYLRARYGVRRRDRRPVPRHLHPRAGRHGDALRALAAHRCDRRRAPRRHLARSVLPAGRQRLPRCR